MFPAPAGMNRTSSEYVHQVGNVPRTRGDEPVIEYVPCSFKICSPHPRG